jgi:DNA primase large subunit
MERGLPPCNSGLIGKQSQGNKLKWTTRNLLLLLLISVRYDLLKIINALYIRATGVDTIVSASGV